MFLLIIVIFINGFATMITGCGVLIFLQMGNSSQAMMELALCLINLVFFTINCFSLRNQKDKKLLYDRISNRMMR